jgi:ubiquinone/menaquinone biosynthesis C-methylase UbiE
MKMYTSKDLSENMLSKAKEKAEKAGFHNVAFAIGDAEDTKEPAEQYDIVINRHLVWTLPHPEKAIKEWKRVLKPGGRLVIMEGNWHYHRLSDRIQVFFGKCLITLVEHRNAFSNDGDYDKDTKEELPMMKSRNARRLAWMVQDVEELKKEENFRYEHIYTARLLKSLPIDHPSKREALVHNFEDAVLTAV